MKKLLWIGDAACDSGFARSTHFALDGIRHTWDVAVMGLNYNGNRHPYPYWIYPASVGGDLFGVRRIASTTGPVALEKPDLVVIQNDPWNIPAYVREFERLANRPKLVGIIAVDGLNCRGSDLNGLDHAIFWTNFAEQEARTGGYNGTSAVVPLGVDLGVYNPGDRARARRALGIDHVVTEDSFMFLNVNRNQPRKRLDLTMEYFAEWYHNRCPEKNAFLFLHVCPTGDRGYDINQLAGYYGLKGRIILSDPGVYRGATEEELVDTYRAADAVISTTQGEGWGLTAMEAMACGVPAVLPRWAALGEWAQDAALMVSCPTTSMTPNNVNSIGAIPDKQEMVEAMDSMYLLASVRDHHREAGLALVRRPEYRWENISARILREIDWVLEQ